MSTKNACNSNLQKIISPSNSTVKWKAHSHTQTLFILQTKEKWLTRCTCIIDITDQKVLWFIAIQGSEDRVHSTIRLW